MGEELNAFYGVERKDTLDREMEKTQPDVMKGNTVRFEPGLT